MLGKADLVKRLSEKTESTQKEAQAHLDAFLDVVREALQSGEDIRLTGFGSFSVQDVAAREGVNPRTREKIHIPAGKRVKFTAGSKLQSAIEPEEPAAPAAKTTSKSTKK